MSKYDPNTRIIKGLVPDAGRAVLGGRDARLGLKLSEGEVTLIERVCAHQELSRSTWVNFAVHRFLTRMQAAAMLHDTDEYRRFLGWKKPKPAETLVVCRVPETVLTPFAKLAHSFADSRTGTLARWALIIEGTAVLATPSQAERRQAATAKLQALQKAQPTPQQVEAAVGYFNGLPSITTKKD